MTCADLFDKIIYVKYDIEGLAGFVQNDFQRMLDDNIITQIDIVNEIPNMEKKFDCTVTKLIFLKKECQKLVEKFKLQEKEQL